MQASVDAGSSKASRASASRLESSEDEPSTKKPKLDAPTLQTSATPEPSIEVNREEAQAAQEETEKPNSGDDQEDDEDILKTGWFYIDSSGNRQGPFLTRDMQGWYQTGFIIDTLLVRRVDQTEYTPLAQHPILKQSPKPLPQAHHVPAVPINPTLFQVYQADPSAGYEEFTNPTDSTHTAVPQGEYLGVAPNPQSSDPYAQRGLFTSLGGRFSTHDPNSYWQSKGLAADKAGRQLSAFFDVDKYQEEMAMKAAQGDKKKPVKLTKKQIEEFKKRKEQRKVKKFLDI